MKYRFGVPIQQTCLLLPIVVFLLVPEICDGFPSMRANLGNINTGTTRAAILWRRMLNQDPLLAAEATMFWRMASVDNPKDASQAALHARKITAKDPEEMFNKAFLYRHKRSLSSEYNSLALEYWRKFAANDPEVTARSSMYWVENPDADMYW